MVKKFQNNTKKNVKLTEVREIVGRQELKISEKI